MTVTVTRDATPIANSDTTKYYTGSSITPSTVFVVTFSDGTQIAITGYDDKEANDIVIGVPTPSGSIDTLNLYMWGINYIEVGAALQVHAYSGGTLGGLLYTFTNSTDSNATLQFNYDTSTGNLAIAFDPDGGAPESDGTLSSFSGSAIFSGPTCYLLGTRILTANGPVPVEALHPGDLVATRFGGLRPVRWIGTQTLLTLGARGMLAPICLRAGAIGENQPAQDLWVSPGHAVLVGEHLVCAYLLVNGTTIVQPPHTGQIRYFHIDLGDHDCVLAEGAWAESYYEHLNRETFDNAAEFHARFPGTAARIQPTCLPYVNQPTDPALPALRALVAARAPQPDFPHLLADGRVIAPDPDSPPGTWRFAVPAGVAHLRLRSPAASPAETFGRADTRRLGLRLRAATWMQDGTALALDLAGDLGDGWHAPEHANGILWRWTDGDAALAVAGPHTGTGTLTLHGYALVEVPRPAGAAE